MIAVRWNESSREPMPKTFRPTSGKMLTMVSHLRNLHPRQELSDCRSIQTQVNAPLLTVTRAASCTLKKAPNPNCIVATTCLNTMTMNGKPTTKKAYSKSGSNCFLVLDHDLSAHSI